MLKKRISRPMLRVWRNTYDKAAQYCPGYRPPVWPDEPDKQRQMAHLDFAVNEFEKAVSYAESCGAEKAAQQFSDVWTVMLDPGGHSFCLCLMKSVMESEYFALL